MKTLWAIAASLALIATACGGGGEEQASASPVVVADDSDADLADSESADSESSDDLASTATDEEIALEFAACMRDEGVDMDDPTVNADGSVNLFGAGQGGGARGREGLQEAFETCGEVLDGATFLRNRESNPEFEDNLLEFAQCLRDQGIDVDDPDFSGGAGQGGGIFGDEFNPLDPANAEIVDACGGLFAGGQQGGQ